MQKMVKHFIWTAVLLAFFPIALSAQFLYTNNDLAAGNSISAYTFDTSGGLTQVTGSPFLTSGSGSGGGLASATRIIIVNNFLYASNSGTNTVSAFAIDPSTGYLTPVLGSPFSTGAFNDVAAGSGISLAATPDGKYLYAGSTGLLGQITIYSIDATGALTIIARSPMAADGPMSSLKVSPDGNYLVATIPSASALSVYAIRKNGSLREIHGYPYVLTSAAATSVDFNCAGTLMYAGTASGTIYAFNFSSGKLTPVTGSPFSTGLASNEVVALSTDDGTLFSSNQAGNSVAAFTLDPNTGGLPAQGTSVNAGDTNPYPGGLAVSNDGAFLFAADQNSSSTGGAGFSIFTVSSAEPFGLLSINPTNQNSPLQSLAVYPPKVCVAPAAKNHP
jgi:6-phosphogluconolactonase (cycloisomerase 2 family)